MKDVNTGEKEQTMEVKMDKILKEIEKKFKLFKTKPASDELILEAERQLGFSFPDDYKKYLSKYGAISFANTELTGLNIDSYANVVSVTLKERQRNSSLPKDAIVLENTGIEGILVLMNKKGEVYIWRNGKILEHFNNLEEYLKSKI